MEFLNNISGTGSKIEEISNRLFEVEKVQLTTGLEGYTIPDAYGIYKKGGAALLGVTGKQFAPTQPKEMFHSLVDGMLSADLEIDDLQFSELKGGSKVRFTFPLGMTSFKNIRGKQDESMLYGNLQTGYDGHTVQSFYLSMYRLICKNGMKASVTEFRASFKNVKGNLGKSSVLVSDLSKVVEQREKLEEILITLNSKKVTKKEADAFLKKAVGYSQKDYADKSTRYQNVADKLFEAVEEEFQRTGRTYWGLVNGITNYTNHYAATSNREDYLYADSGAKINDKAMKLALEAARN